MGILSKGRYTHFIMQQNIYSLNFHNINFIICNKWKATGQQCIAWSFIFLFSNFKMNIISYFIIATAAFSIDVNNTFKNIADINSAIFFIKILLFIWHFKIFIWYIHYFSKTDIIIIYEIHTLGKFFYTFFN